LSSLAVLDPPDEVRCRGFEARLHIAAALMCAALAVGGCADDGGAHSTPGAPDAGSDVDTDDLCPDPDDPRVHYLSTDPNQCFGVKLECTTEQNGFQNGCGCGCIDKDEGDPLCPPVNDPSVDWVSHDPADCDPTPPSCDLGQFGFSNSCGCGCMTPGT